MRWLGPAPAVLTAHWFGLIVRMEYVCSGKSESVLTAHWFGLIVRLGAVMRGMIDTMVLTAHWFGLIVRGINLSFVPYS